MFIHIKCFVLNLIRNLNNEMAAAIKNQAATTPKITNKVSMGYDKRKRVVTHGKSDTKDDDHVQNSKCDTGLKHRQGEN